MEVDGAFLCCLHTKSLHRSRAGRHFYGTENVIAGFGPIGNIEKTIWDVYEQLLRTVFHDFECKKKKIF